MQRYNRIIRHQRFVYIMKRMHELEEDRIFCRHDLTHLLDVCRVAYIFALEEQMCELIGGKDIIYAAGLLHDLGRVMQYEEGTPHEQASMQLAGEILPDCGYTDEEIACIQAAIGHHRQSTRYSGTESVESSEKHLESMQDKTVLTAENAAELLSAYLYRADKAVRNCFCCEAAAECNWDESRKNQGIV